MASPGSQLRYSGFISYSHAVDGRLAPALQSAVCRFARPWYRRSTIRIFRDQTDLSISPGLWSSIEKALADSAHFILLASPRAAASKWVRRELEYWLARRSSQTVLIVVTEGTVAWNDARGDFDWQGTDALPDTLGKVFGEEPLYLDLRSVSRVQHLAQDNPVFRDTVAALASVLLGRPKDELIGEDIAVRRRARRTAWLVGIVLFTMVILLGLSTWFAVSQSNSLARSLKVVRGQKLAAEAQLVRNRSDNLLQTSALLTLEALELAPSAEAEAFLRQTVAMLLPPIKRLQHPFSPDGALPVPRIRVRMVAFSPDGRDLVTVGDDPAARLWDVATGQEVRQFTHSGDLGGNGLAAAFTPDGSSLITSTLEGITFWDTASGQQTAHRKMGDAARSLAVSSDGRYLAAGHWSGSLVVTELRRGREVLRGKHDSIVNSVAFSPDSTLLVSGSNDNSARIWALPEGREVRRLPHRFGVLGVAFSPDGKLIATGGWEGLARVWEQSSGRQVASFDHRSAIQSVAFSVDGKRLATAGDDATARVWDLVTGVEVARATHDDAVSSVVFAANGRYLATASKDSAHVWKATYGSEIAQLAHPEDIVTAIAFSPDGRRVVTACGTTARVWDIGSERETIRLNHDGRVAAVAFTPDGNSVETSTVPALEGPNRTCVRVWDAGSGTLRSELCQGHSAIAFGQDGSHVALANQDGVSVRDLASGASIVAINDIVDVTFDWTVALSPHRNYVAAAAGGPRRDQIYIWDAVSGKRLQQMSDGDITQLAFSADERFLAAGSEDGIVHVWEVGSGREVTRIGLTGGVGAVAFAADSRHLATGGRDQTVRVWEIPEGKEVARFELGGNISGVCFSPDVELVAAASSDRTARVWKWRHEDLISEACAHLSRNLTLEEWRTYLGDEPYRPTCPDLPSPQGSAAQATGTHAPGPP